MSVLLLDADILVYECAHRAQITMDWEGDGEKTATADFPAAQNDFRATVRTMIRELDATEVVVVLSEDDHDGNFRRKVFDGYKRSREGAKATPRPVLFGALREWITATFEAKIKPGIEGDDTIGILATLPTRAHLDQIMCSIDKDMGTIPGRHFNWRKPDLGVVTVTEEEADYNHLFQTLTGDSTDGYPGCPGVGVKRAARLLDAEILPEYLEEHRTLTLWRRVVAAFEKKGLTEDDALVQARCARILRAEDFNFETGEPILWTP